MDFDLLRGFLHLRHVRGEAEVDELQRRLRGAIHEEDVLGLDVSVDDVNGMAIPRSYKS